MAVTLDVEQGEGAEPGRPAGVSSGLPVNPIATAVHLRPRRIEGAAEHFAATDPHLDVTARFPRLARLAKHRRFQFMLILPNQLIFWIVIFVGIMGATNPGRNFATAITWYIWFCLVFVLMVAVGRGWCAMCAFGGFGEWIQRRTFWRRTTKRLGLGWKLPESWAGHGLLISLGVFVGLTWIEEFFNIAGPGTPAATSIMVIGIVASALLVFMLFERRTFCRYICPLSSLIGTVGAMGSVAGFRTRDRQQCLSCPTKDCMRGGEEGYGCPWYTWPGSADSNLLCGICSECYKACPYDNVGLFVQKPLTSVVAPVRRRYDVAIAVLVLWGLVIFQQVNALNWYASLDGWLNRATGMAYPNPIDYIGIIALVAAATAGVVALIRVIGGGARRSTAPDAAGGSTVASKGGLRAWLMPVSYGLIPVVGADYLARQLPKFFKHAPRVVSAVAGPFGFHPGLYNTRLAGNGAIVAVQVGVMALGTVVALWTMWKTVGRDVLAGGLGTRPAVVRIAATGLVLACGIAAAVLYVAMHAAS